MYNYLAYLHGGLKEPGISPAADGIAMAEECLRQLETTGNPEQFPPRLLILLTSPAYHDETRLREMLTKIRQTFADYKRRTRYLQLPEDAEVPLLGSSVAAVIFDHQIYRRGALLICLASRLIEAKVAASVEVRDKYEEAVPLLLKRLKLDFPGTGSFAPAPKPLTDPLLLTFFPEQGAHNDTRPYLAPELHRLLRQQVFTRIPIVGGVAASPGFQFVNKDVLRSALVAARIFTGAPYASIIGHGLKEKETYLRIQELGEDLRTVQSFDQPGRPAELLELNKNEDFALLGELSLESYPLVTVARLASDGHVRMLREVQQNNLFKLLERDPVKMRQKAAEMLQGARQRQTLEMPVGCFTLHCAARLDAGLDFAGIVEDAMQVMIGHGKYLGGFFDGEAGVDESGRYLFGNWCVSTLCLSDEMRERTPAHTGFKAIADAAPSLTSVASLQEALKHSLQVIFDTGFPGVMLSLVMQNNKDTWLVARQAVGARYTKIVDDTQRPLAADDILAHVIKTQKPEFIPDSRTDKRCDRAAIEKSGLISQYILPLYDRERKPIAVLQYDMGDLTRRQPGIGLFDAEHRLLQSLGTVVEATVLRVLNREEADRALKLDEVLKRSLLAQSREQALKVFLAGAAQHFGGGMWHIRLPNANKERMLEMVDGLGEYFTVLKTVRPQIRIESESPTARAFRDNQAVAVNLAQEDKWHRKLLDSCRNDPKARAVCEQTNAYANVPIRGDKGQPIGTLSVLSFEKWFFTRSRIRTLDALSQRLGYLLEHFQKRKFLLEIGSDFLQIANFSRPYQAINEAVKRLRVAANAEVASLFLWDQESKRLILRAQDGWEEPEWVDAARYQMGEPWTGKVAQARQPQYEPDMYAYKIKNGMSANNGYALKLFGRVLAEDFSMEAIGLPLRTREDRPLGVITLFRQMERRRTHQATGFTTLDQRPLQEAADTMSAMLQLLLGKLRMDWYQKEVKRHKEVRDALERGDHRIPLETRLCRQMVESFHMIRADLYLATAGTAPFRWAASEYLSEGASVLRDSQMVVRAGVTQEIQERRHPLSGNKWQDLRSAKTEALIERVCLPLIDSKHLVGVLDLYCRVERRRSSLLAVHDPQQLNELAAEIALVYLQQQELALTAKRQLTVQAMGSMVFSSSHRLMNLVQNIRSQSILIKLAKSDEERQLRLTELIQIISAATEHIERPMKIARQMIGARSRPCRLRELVTVTLSEFNLAILSPKLQLHVEIATQTNVLADADLIREAFRNIIYNAIKAMPEGGTLTIAEQPDEDQNLIQIGFSDTGIGMSEERIKAALEGFVEREGGIGLGVHVSLLLVRALNGNLLIESKPGTGTTVTVLLPISRKEIAP